MDTFYWVALTSPNDSSYRVVESMDDVLSTTSLVTTDEVLVEFLTFFAADPWLRQRAAETVQQILQDPEVCLVPQSHESFLNGLELYRNRPDKSYSLTDCISMQTMRNEGLTEVLTNDRHFEQEGFRTLFRGANPARGS